MSVPLLHSRQLYRPMALAAAMAILAGLLAYTGHRAGQAALAERNTAWARYSRIATELRQSQADQESLRQQAALLLELQGRGMVGETGPHEWTEQAHDIRQRMGLPRMKYQFLPAASPGDDAEPEVRTTSMALHLQILHEEDLLGFLEHLQKEAKALVHVRGCRLTRLPPAALEEVSPGALLAADCELDWTTVRPARTGRP